MTLDISTTSSIPSQWQPSGWSASAERVLQPGDWVTLREPISPFNHREALLLCRQVGDWVVWIPDHGEATMSPSQFC
ncbi:MAG TPA: hypothetical protein V6D06_05090 [Trichocoleus sp.]